MVYFVRMVGTDFIKIGFTTRDPGRRIAELQTSAPRVIL